jgi:hypothetical protein
MVAMPPATALNGLTCALPYRRQIPPQATVMWRSTFRWVQVTRSRLGLAMGLGLGLEPKVFHMMHIRMGWDALANAFLVQQDVQAACSHSLGWRIAL